MQQVDSTVDGDIISLIHDVTLQFQRSGPDVQNIQRTIQDIRETEKIRREMLQEARSINQRMSRSLQISRSKGVREHVDPESMNHEDLMLQMEQKKFTAAKMIQDLDQDISSLEAEVHQLRMQSLELDSSYKSRSVDAESRTGSNERNLSPDAGTDSRGQGTARRGQGDVVMDGNEEEDIMDDAAHAMAVLRLQLYKGLGVEMLENELGVYSKARIRSSTRKDVHLVNFDDQLSPYFQTNLIWEFAS
ncbi:kinetochore-associated Ndc80 complex subunit spc24 [Modicella reniformis]|uniref:Kinetochore protein Spc24 n=1 Tax=Modicella reniformis TaxID=1440133 RepID=A0A9P6MBV9_9FUNG|nr:kinetochore-associated Ndc80 complex subunit spc24 [Modicella reniformis]